MSENVGLETVGISPSLRDVIRVKNIESDESYDQRLRRQLEVDLSHG